MSEPFISELHLKNFKCYEELTLQLKAGVNLLYGLNGSGKTSLLEAISIASASLFMEWDPIYNVGKRFILDDEIRLSTPRGMLLPEFQFPASVKAKGGVLGSSITWLRDRNSFEGGTTSAGAVQMQEKSRQATLIAQNGRQEVLPIIAYFSTNRLYVARRETPNVPTGRFKGYFNAVNDSNTQKQIKAWFKDASFFEYQQRQSDPAYYDIGLAGLRKAALEVFGTRWSSFFYYEPEADSNLPKGFFFTPENPSDSVLPETNLSDGQRNFFWLFLEIAWRCYMLNPYLGENAAAETNGIVMIDEVDLHLHPEWQQKVLGMLTKAFPKIQFVITTHSPIVLGSVKEGQVILLEGQTATAVERPYGLKPSYILEVLMKVNERLPELKAPIESYLNLINNGEGKSDQAIAIRSALEELLSPEDPLFVEADILLDFLTPATI